jgi:hypothetical protein
VPSDCARTVDEANHERSAWTQYAACLVQHPRSVDEADCRHNERVEHAIAERQRLGHAASDRYAAAGGVREHVHGWIDSKPYAERRGDAGCADTDLQAAAVHRHDRAQREQLGQVCRHILVEPLLVPLVMGGESRDPRHWFPPSVSGGSRARRVQSFAAFCALPAAAFICCPQQISEWTACPSGQGQAFS